MTAGPIHDLSRYERTDIVLRADLRGQLPDVQEGGAMRAPSPSVAKAALLVLDSFPPDRCFPSEAWIARAACTTDRTLRRALKGLKAAGYIQARARPPAQGKRYQGSSIYRIDYQALAALDPRLTDQESAPAHMAAPAQWATPPRPNGPPPTEPALAHRDTPPRPNGPARPGPMGRLLQTSLPAHELKQTSTDEEGRREEIRRGPWVAEVTPALVAIGVSRRRIPDLCRQAGSRERVREVIALLQERIRNPNLKPIRSPGAWIAMAIADGYGINTNGAAP